MGIGLPKIWTGVYSSFSEWRDESEIVFAHKNLLDDGDNLHIKKYTQFRFGAYCACCALAQNMTFDWSMTFSDRGRLFIPWTEILRCDACGMNSRMRAVWGFVNDHLSHLDVGSHVYMPEAVTPGFLQWQKRFPLMVGSEYVASDAEPGSLHDVDGYSAVRHEDLTRLSFVEKSFDLIVSQDVFEHIPNFIAAFSECFRVLKPGGTLLFSIPFFPELETTDIRVTISDDGSLQSIHPFEFHGNPMSSGGSLCFQHFGWSLLDNLRSVGFSDARAHSYWSPAHGHLGSPYFVFSARR